MGTVNCSRSFIGVIHCKRFPHQVLVLPVRTEIIHSEPMVLSNPTTSDNSSSDMSASNKTKEASKDECERKVTRGGEATIIFSPQLKKI